MLVLKLNHVTQDISKKGTDYMQDTEIVAFYKELERLEMVAKMIFSIG